MPCVICSTTQGKNEEPTKRRTRRKQPVQKKADTESSDESDEKDDQENFTGRDEVELDAEEEELV